MNALKIAQAIQEEANERAELKSMLSSVLNKLDELESKINFKKEGEEQLLQLREVCSLVGFAHNWVYDRMKEDNFPQPLKLGSSSRWKRSEIIVWMEAQKSYRVN